jgi:hypothetical protein
VQQLGAAEHNQRRPLVLATGKARWHDAGMSRAVPSGPRRAAGPVLAALAAVLAVHAWLLAMMPAPGDHGTPPAQPAPARAAAWTLTHAVPPAAPAPALPQPLRPAAAPDRLPPPPMRRSNDLTMSALTLPRASAPGMARSAATAPAGSADASASAADEDLDVPTYDTRLPPAATLAYRLQRGATIGSAELTWAPADGSYELQMRADAAGRPWIGWDSRGGFDAAGIAPERFVDRRRGRDAQAANFRRDRGRISFSGAAADVPLPPGTQDRLSWMLQLAAIVAADPGRFEPGAQVLMGVAGARGDLSVWRFTVESRETLELPAGPVAGALRLRREPGRPYDTQVEVWLDPVRHHLPVLVRMGAAPSGEVTEFSLHDARVP